MVKATIVIALVSMGAVCATGAGAQGVPAEGSVLPPTAQSSRGFTSITSVREIGGGRILVADRGERRLYVVNWETAAVDQVLRQGDGPREYREIGWLYAIADNETLLTTLGRQWILLRDTQVAQTFIGTSPLNRRSRARLDGVATGGSVLASVSAETRGNFIADERVLELAPGLGPHERLPRLDTVRLVTGAGRDQLACVLSGTRGAPRCRFLEPKSRPSCFRMVGSRLLCTTRIGSTGALRMALGYGVSCWTPPFQCLKRRNVLRSTAGRKATSGVTQPRSEVMSGQRQSHRS
jgi:hypothetical protein